MHFRTLSVSVTPFLHLSILLFVMIYCAVGGGTGSGLGCLLLERLSVDYGKSPRFRSPFGHTTSGDDRRRNIQHRTLRSLAPRAH
jgi:hypothetical protein